MSSLNKQWLMRYPGASQAMSCETPGFRAKLLLLLLLLLLFATVMQGIYNYMPETNDVSRVYSVAPVLYSAAPVLYFQFVLHVMLPPMLKVLYYYY